MKATWTQCFSFSACYADQRKVRGHNYTLGVTVDALGRDAEETFKEKIEAALIRKLESRDLGTDVDFLKGIAVSDLTLLKTFWPIIVKEIHPMPLYSLSLEKDKKSRTILSGPA